MKTKMHRLIGLLLCCIMLTGLIPITSFAEDAGYTKANPIKVSNYAELKSAMENPKISYVEVSSGTNIEEVTGVTVSNSPLITVNGLKVLTVNGTVNIGASAISDNAVRSLLYIYGSGNYLRIEGSGSLTFRANGSNAMNAAVEVVNSGTLSVDGDVTIKGSYNNAVYGTAIFNNTGTVQIHSGTFIGELADNSSGGWSGAVRTGANSQTFIRNATLKSIKAAAGGDEPVFCTTVYVAEDAYVQIENSTIEATRNATNGHSIYIDDVDKNVSNCLSDGQKIYRLSDNAQLNANASYLKDSVFIARGLQNEITAVELAANEITTGTKVSDMALTCYSRDVSTGNYSIYEGLGQTGSGTALSSSAELKPQRDYSAVYELTAITGKNFVNDLAADDIKFRNGYVTDVILSADTKTARLFVNLPRNARAITELSFETPEIGIDTTANDMRITKFPRDKVVFRTFFVYSGLKQTGQQLAWSTVLDPADDYSVIYQFTAENPNFFADDLTPKDISVTNGVVTDVKLYNNNTTAEIYVDFPKSSIISKLALETNKITKTTTVNDLRITKFPNDKVWVYIFFGYDGLTKTESDSGFQLDGDTVISPFNDYSAVYELHALEGKTFAEDFNKDNITFKNGEVWDISLLNNNTVMIIYVNFPKIDPNITSVSLNVKKPVPGDALGESHTPVSAEPDRYTVIDADWYVSENGVSKHIYEGDKFELEKKYKVLFTIEPTDRDNTKFVYYQITVKINGYAATIISIPTAGYEIVAQYTFTMPKDMKMTFAPNGGTGTQEPVNIDEYYDVTMPECMFTKEGDEFFAWNVDGSLYFPGDTCNITQNTTATAVWKSELTKDIAVTMSTISEGKTPADITFGSDGGKFTVSAVWYEGDSVDKLKKVNSASPLSVNKNYTVQLTINSPEFLAAHDDLNITLNGKKMKNILSRKSKQVVIDVQILNDIGVEFFEPMGGVPLAASGDIKPNSDRFFVSTAVWFDKANAALKDKLNGGTVAELSKTYYLTLNLRSTAENQIFGGDTVKVNGKAYPITSRGGVSEADYVAVKPQFTASYPQVKISEDSDGYIIVNSPIAMNVTLAVALYDAKGKLIDVGTAQNCALASGNNKISPANIVGTQKIMKFLRRTMGEKVKVMAFQSVNSLLPMCPVHNYKYNTR